MYPQEGQRGPRGRHRQPPAPPPPSGHLSGLLDGSGAPGCPPGSDGPGAARAFPYWTGGFTARIHPTIEADATARLPDDAAPSGGASAFAPQTGDILTPTGQFVVPAGVLPFLSGSPPGWTTRSTHGPSPGGPPDNGNRHPHEPARGVPSPTQPADRPPFPGGPTGDLPHAGEPTGGWHHPGAPTSGFPYPAEPTGGQPYPTGPTGAQRYPVEPTGGQRHPGEAARGVPYPGEPTGGAAYPGGRLPGRPPAAARPEPPAQSPPPGPPPGTGTEPAHAPPNVPGRQLALRTAPHATYQVPPADHPADDAPSVPPPARTYGRPGATRRLTLGDGLAGGGALVVVIGSFLPFVAYTDRRLAGQGGHSDSWSAWAAQTFMAPLTWIGVLAAAGLLVLTVTRTVRAGIPPVLSFSAVQLQVVLGLFITMLFAGYALATKRYLFGTEVDAIEVDGQTVDATLSLREGGYLMAFFSLVALTGALLNLRADRVPAEPEVREPDAVEPIPSRYSSPPRWAAPGGHRPTPALPPAFPPQPARTTGPAGTAPPLPRPVGGGPPVNVAAPPGRTGPATPPAPTGWTRGPRPAGPVPGQPAGYGPPAAGRP